MKPLDTLRFDYKRCVAELADLKGFLENSKWLDEQKEILPFFRDRKHLSGFIGNVNQDINPPDRVSHEYTLWGQHRCDLVVGCTGAGAICLVEFEDAQPNSIFNGEKGDKEWSPRLEHGFSQLVDWFHVLDQQRDRVEKEFGFKITSFTGALVVGRNHQVIAKERERIDWRATRVMVNSHKISILTFDDLFQMLDRRVQAYAQASQ